MEKFNEWIGRRCLMALALVMCLCMTGTAVWAKTSGDTASAKADGEYVELPTQWLDLGESETSASGGLQTFASGGVPLRSGNYANWIDRIVIPDYAQKFYNDLVEASDNDGSADWLIDVTKGARNNAGDYVVEVTTIRGKAASSTAMNREINEKFQQAGPYVRAAFDAFDRDHPEVFWLTGNTRIMSGGGYNTSTYAYELTIYLALKVSGTSAFDIRADGYQNAGTIRSDIQKRDAQVRAITGSVTDTDIAGKVRSLNQWLTKNNGYNTGSGNNFPASAFECLSALTGSRGAAGPVCEGYARAFKLLCDTMGIPCVLVDGNAVNVGGSGPHMWNYVRIGARWYGVDVTWNDPLGYDGSDTEGNENYLLVGADTVIAGRRFIDSHPVSNQVSSSGLSFKNGPQLSSRAFDGTVQAVSVADCQISISPTKVAYDGKDKCPAVLVFHGSLLTKNVDYTLTYRNNRNVGTATVEIRGMGDYTGTVTRNFTITKPAKGTKLTDSKTKIIYQVTGSTTVACAGTANKSATAVKIPATVKLAGATYKVTSVANNAFKSNKKLKTVTIGSNVTSIGSCAFQNCTVLTKITIPAKVAKIGSKAFNGCKKLLSVTIKSQKLTTKNVGSQAFAKMGSSNYKKIKVSVPKKKYAVYKAMLKAKGLSTRAKIVKK